jgi:glutathione S-transferase
MMKLYLTPGSCSTGIHILLEELELVFEAHLVNLLAGTQNTPEYLAMNPKATIPTLVRNDGTALTEFQAPIGWHVAILKPNSCLVIRTATRVSLN